MVIPRKKRMRIFARDRYTCRYCACDMRLHFPYPHLGLLTIDHIVPKIAGGTNAIENLATCCCFCNVRKRQWPLSQFLRDLQIDALLGITERTCDERRLRFLTARARLARRALRRERRKKRRLVVEAAEA
jgi:hypothetical protein